MPALGCETQGARAIASRVVRIRARGEQSFDDVRVPIRCGHDQRDGLRLDERRRDFQMAVGCS